MEKTEGYESFSTEGNTGKKRGRKEVREGGKEGTCQGTHLSWSFWSFFLKRRGLLLFRPPAPPPRCLAEV